MRLGTLKLIEFRCSGSSVCNQFGEYSMVISVLCLGLVFFSFFEFGCRLTMCGGTVSANCMLKYAEEIDIQDLFMRCASAKSWFTHSVIQYYILHHNYSNHKNKIEKKGKKEKKKKKRDKTRQDETKNRISTLHQL